MTNPHLFIFPIRFLHMPVVASKREVFRRVVHEFHSGHPLTVEDYHAKVRSALGDIEQEAPYSEFEMGKKFIWSGDVDGKRVTISISPGNDATEVEVERDGHVRQIRFTANIDREHLGKLLRRILDTKLPSYGPISKAEDLLETLKATYHDSNAMALALRNMGFEEVDVDRSTYRLPNKARVIVERAGNRVRVYVEHPDPREVEKLKRKVKALLQKSLSWRR